MRKLWVAILFLSSTPHQLVAQIDNSVAANFRVNFAVPDAPAFDILGIQPNQILRPVSVRDLAAGIAGFRGSSIVIPRSFATEISPALLVAGARLSLQDYGKRPALYRLRLSAATNRATEMSRLQVGAGIRLSLIDRADPRTDPALIANITRVLALINSVYVEQLTEPPLPPDPQSGVVNREMLTPARRARVELLEGQIQALRDAHKNANWNAPALDIAYAIRGSTADSLGTDPRVDAHAVWATFASNFGAWSQVLLGVRGGVQRDDSDDKYTNIMSAAARMYAGANDQKIFLELQLSRDVDHDTDVLFHGGGEIAIPHSVWGNVGVALEQMPGSDRKRLVTRFALKVGLPTVR